jgi:hypothetical protein
VESTPSTTVNKNFLEELNKKLDNKVKNNLEVRTGGLSFQPDSKISEKEKN